MHNAICELRVWNQLLVICLNTPPPPTWGRSMHFCGQAPRPPPLTKSPNKGANRLGLVEDSKNIFIICWKWPRKFLEPLPPISEPPQMTTYQLTPQNRLIYIPIDSFWRQDSEYAIHTSINMWRRTVTITTASWRMWGMSRHALAGCLSTAWRWSHTWCRITL